MVPLISSCTYEACRKSGWSFFSGKCRNGSFQQSTVVLACQGGLPTWKTAAQFIYGTRCDIKELLQGGGLGAPGGRRNPPRGNRPGESCGPCLTKEAMHYPRSANVLTIVLRSAKCPQPYLRPQECPVERAAARDGGASSNGDTSPPSSQMNTQDALPKFASLIDFTRAKRLPPVHTRQQHSS